MNIFFLFLELLEELHMAIFQTNPPNNFNEIYDHISRKVCMECMPRLRTSGPGLTRPSVITEAPNSAISFTIQTNKIIGKSIYGNSILLYCNQDMYWLCFSTYDECLDTLKEKVEEDRLA